MLIAGTRIEKQMNGQPVRSPHCEWCAAGDEPVLLTKMAFCAPCLATTASCRTRTATIGGRVRWEVQQRFMVFFLQGESHKHNMSSIRLDNQSLTRSKEFTQSLAKSTHKHLKTRGFLSLLKNRLSQIVFSETILKNAISKTVFRTIKIVFRKSCFEIVF